MRDDTKGVILIVDDTPDSVSIVETILTEAGYRVSIATSGETALDRISMITPDLILLDIMMPGIDGYETCKRLKASEKTKDIPIIFLSALTESYDKVKGFEIGAVDYVIKPIAPEEILIRVQTQIKLSRYLKQIETQNNEIQRANKQLRLITEITRHDILNKVNALQALLKIVNMQINAFDVEEEFLRLESITNTIRSQIEFTKKYGNLGIQKPQWQNINTMLFHVSTAENRKINAPIEELEIYADLLLEEVFVNLLDNSLRHGQKVTTIQISTTSRPDELILTWEDDGVGIPTAEKELIFERGFGKNTGFGLFFIRDILAITGISIMETGTPRGGARFEITIPAGKFRRTV